MGNVGSQETPVAHRTSGVRFTDWKVFLGVRRKVNQPISSDSETPQGTQESSPPRRFSYPREPWRFRIFWPMLFVALLGIGYLPHVRSWQMMAFAAGTCAVAAIIAMGVLGDWTRWYGQRREFLITDEGISTEAKARGRRSLKWEDIRDIRSGGLGDGFVVRLKKEAVWSRLELLAYPFVYTDIVPEIARHRPDLRLDSGIQRLLAEPTKPTMRKRWWNLPILACNAILMLIAFQSGILPPYCYFLRFLGHWGSFWAIMGLIFISLSAGSAHRFPNSMRQAFVRSAMLCPMMIVFGLILHFATEAPRRSIEILGAAGMTITVLAGAITLLPGELTRRRLGIILLVLLGVAGGVFVYRNATTLPGRDISHLLPQTRRGIIWSPSGKQFAPQASLGLGYVVDLPSLERRPIPRHQRRSLIYWLDDVHLIRKVMPYTEYPASRPADEECHLYSYDFLEEHETKIATAAWPFNAVVSPDGRYLAYLKESPRVQMEDGCEPTEHELSVYNLLRNNQVSEPLVLPEPIVVNWWGVGWRDSTTVVVEGTSKVPPGSREIKTALHLFSLNLQNRQTEHFISNRRFRYWHLSPDFGRAFAVDYTNESKTSISYVDLPTEEVVELVTGEIPTWQQDGRYAFRLRDHQANQWLARFDAQARTETLLLRTPPNTVLKGISPKGRFALFGKLEILSLRISLIMDISTGKTFTMENPGVNLVAWWSPDDRNLIIESTSFLRDARWTILFELPPS